MFEKKQHWWNNGWLVGIGTAVLGTLALRLIDWVWETNILYSNWLYITRTYQTPLWVFVLLILGCVLSIYLVIHFLVGSTNNIMADVSTPQKKKYLEFTEMQYGGLLIKWSWMQSFDGEYKVGEIRICCPKDGCQLTYSRVCPICNSHYSTYQYPFDSHKLNLLIQHKAETEYK